MADQSFSFGMSFSNGQTHSPINKHGMKSVSTPINDVQVLDEGDLSEIPIEAFEKHGSTPSSNSDVNSQGGEKKKLHSILKNSPNKSDNQNNSATLASVSESLLKKHPGLRIATTNNGEINPVKGARVIFSPTKEILSYRNDYLSDDDVTPSPPPQVLRGRSKKINLDKNRAKVILSEGFYEEAEANIEPNDDDDDDEYINLTAEKHPNVLGSSFSNSKTFDQQNNETNNENNNETKYYDGILKVFNRLVTDPKIPYVLSLYVQLFLNISLISLLAYLIFIFVKTVRSDINQKIEMYTMDALHEISLCSREYFRNKCSIENGNVRVPALEKTCTMWGKCMNRDPQLIGKSKVTAETFADIINGFLKPISWKSLFLMTFHVLITFFFTNRVFGDYRHSTYMNQESETNKINSLESRLYDQEQLLSQYKEQNEKLQANQSYYQGDMDTPSATRLESPHSFDDGTLVRSKNINSSFHSPLQNKFRYR